MEPRPNNEIRKLISNIEDMLLKGLLQKIIGQIPKDPKVCIITWARNPPKKVFVKMVEIAKKANDGVSPTVYVDDMCSLLDTECSHEEQQKRNSSYRDFFSHIGCVVTFSSDLYPGKDIISMLQEFKVNVNLSPSYFIKFLPKNKRDAPEIPVKEYYHMLFELLLMSKASEKNNCILTGPFSEIIVHAHRLTSKNPMTGLITSKLG